MEKELKNKITQEGPVLGFACWLAVAEFVVYLAVLFYAMYATMTGQFDRQMKLCIAISGLALVAICVTIAIGFALNAGINWMRYRSKSDT